MIFTKLINYKNDSLTSVVKNVMSLLNREKYFLDKATRVMYTYIKTSKVVIFRLSRKRLTMQV